MRIEICSCNSEDENFEHEGYFDSIDEAIEWLQLLKQQEEINNKIQQLKQYQALKMERQADCNKCVYQYNKCSGAVLKYNAVMHETKFFCPPDLNYKRDPPDGGYYG